MYMPLFYGQKEHARIKKVMLQLREHFGGKRYEVIKDSLNSYWSPQRIEAKVKEKGLNPDVLDLLANKISRMGGLFSKDLLYRIEGFGHSTPEILAFLPFLEPFCSYTWEELTFIARGIDPALASVALQQAEPQEDLVDVVEEFVSHAGGIEALKSAGLKQKEINCLLQREKPSHTVLGLLAPVLKLEPQAIADLADRTTWLEKPKCAAKV